MRRHEISFDDLPEEIKADCVLMDNMREQFRIMADQKMRKIESKLVAFKIAPEWYDKETGNFGFNVELESMFFEERQEKPSVEELIKPEI